MQESVEVGRLREALDAQRAEFDDLQLRAQRDKHDAREQQQRLRAKLEAELAEVEDAHAAVLERKEAAVRKAQDQARRAQEELDVVEAEQRAAVHEALSLRKQLETMRSEERDAAQRTSSGMVEVLEGQKEALGFERVEGDPDVVKISVVGVGMRSHAGVAMRMFQALADKGINIQVISTSEIKISVLVSDTYTELALRSLHTAYGLDSV